MTPPGRGAVPSTRALGAGMIFTGLTGAVAGARLAPEAAGATHANASSVAVRIAPARRRGGVATRWRCRPPVRGGTTRDPGSAMPQPTVRRIARPPPGRRDGPGCVPPSPAGAPVSHLAPLRPGRLPAGAATVSPLIGPLAPNDVTAGEPAGPRRAAQVGDAPASGQAGRVSERNVVDGGGIDT
jgi:hypothetical protein